VRTINVGDIVAVAVNAVVGERVASRVGVGGGVFSGVGVSVFKSDKLKAERNRQHSISNPINRA
jgi:hypothetical protein